MKGLIKIASLFVVAAVLTGCCGWDSWGGNNCCKPKCCPQPQIWENNGCCEQGGY